MKRKQITVDVIHDLSKLLEYKILKTIQDGTQSKPAKPSVYVIESRAQQPSSKGTKRRRGIRTATCILKTFPQDVANERYFRVELAANENLVRSIVSSSPEEACDAFFDLLSNPPAERWPCCVGQVQVPVSPRRDGEWISVTDNQVKTCHGLLLEYMPDITLLTADAINGKIASEVKQILADLHELKILHRDHVDHSKWPEIGFGNIFLRKNPKTGEQEPIIMDFNRAVVMTDSPKDKALMKAEVDRMEDILARAMSKRQMVDHVPKEVKRLLA